MKKNVKKKEENTGCSSRIKFVVESTLRRHKELFKANRRERGKRARTNSHRTYSHTARRGDDDDAPHVYNDAKQC